MHISFLTKPTLVDLLPSKLLSESLEIRIPPSIAKQARHVRVQRVTKELSSDLRRVKAKFRPRVLHDGHEVLHGKRIDSGNTSGSMVLRGRLYAWVALNSLSFCTSFVGTCVGVWS